QRRRRHRRGERVPRRRRAPRRSHRGDLHRRPGAGAGRLAPRGAGAIAPGHPERLGHLRRAPPRALARRGGSDGGTAPPAAACAGPAIRADGMSGPGLVSLVGAGPGDPELLTLRAVARLGEANVVFYDALVDRAALRYAPRARGAYVGKRAFRPSISQDTIQRLMIRRAVRGERVVRLKSGDPFVFGRGGEEGPPLGGR